MSRRTKRRAAAVASPQWDVSESPAGTPAVTSPTQEEPLLAGRFRELFAQLPLNDIDADAWECFLQSEATGDLIEPLIVLSYTGGGGDTGAIDAYDDGDERNGTTRDAAVITDVMQQIVDAAIKEKCIASDARFWKQLRTVPPRHDDTNRSLPLTPPQALLLLVVQCIFDGHPKTSIAAARLFLLLCQFPQATENFFSPNLFIARRVLLPLTTLPTTAQPKGGRSRPRRTEDPNASTTMRSDDDEDDQSPSGRGDGAAAHKKKTSSSAVQQWSNADVEMTLRTLKTVFLKTACGGASLLRLDAGRSFVATMLEAVCEGALKWSAYPDLRIHAKDTIVDFMADLDRHRLLAAARHATTESHDDDPTVGDLVPISTATGAPLAEPLLFGCSCFLRQAAAALVGRRSTGKQAINERQNAIDLLTQLIERVPALLDPSILRVEGRKCEDAAARPQLGRNDDEDSDDDQPRGRHRRHSSDADAVGIASDDDEPERPKKPPPLPSRKQPGPIKRRRAAEKQREAESHANDPILALLSRCCLTSPDRKEARDATGAALRILLEAARKQENLNGAGGVPPLMERFGTFVSSLMVSARSTWRLLAVDIGTATLFVPALRAPSADAPASGLMSVFGSLVLRLRDSQGAIRARASECLGSLIAAAASQVASHAGGLSAFGDLLLRAAGTAPEGGFLNLRAILLDIAHDEKQMARRAALTLIQAIAESVAATMPDTAAADQGTFNIQGFAAAGCLDVLPRLAADPGILVRAKAVATITEILTLFPTVVPIQRLWLATVPPAAVCDPEKSVSERGQDAVAAVILQPISLAAVQQAAVDGTAWPGPLGLLAAGSPEDVEYVQRSLTILHKREGALPSPFLKTLREICQGICLTRDTHWPVACFELIQEVTAIQKGAISASLLSQCWVAAAKRIKAGIYVGETAAIARCILVALRNVGDGLDADEKRALGKSIVPLLLTFSTPLSLVTPMVQCLVQTAPKKELSAFTADVLKAVQDMLVRRVGVPEGGSPTLRKKMEELKAGDATLRCGLLTLGDLAAFANCTAPPQLTTLVHALASGTSQSKTVVITEPDNISATTRAAALLALGKLCTANEALAKKLLSYFAAQLLEGVNDAVRCNALVVFTDFCVRFGSLTDRFLPQFTACLGAACALVRKQSLALIAGLLAQDYLKCKGLLLYRLLTALGDGHESVRSLAELTVTYVIMPKQANFIQNNFLETLCFICGVTTHPMFRPTVVGGTTFLKAGTSSFCLLRRPDRRRRIYAFFLRHMSDRDRHELSRRIVHTFLTAFVDGDEASGRRLLDLPRSSDEPLGAALRDALRLLGCKQMKITFDKQRPAERGGDDEDPAEPSSNDKTDEVAAAQQAAYELNLLKRNLAHQILPPLLSLKRVMEDACSPFLRDILQCLSALLFDYRSELSELLFHDPMLAKQLDLDFKRGTPQASWDLSADATSRPLGGRPSLLLDSVEPSPHPGLMVPPASVRRRSIQFSAGGGVPSARSGGLTVPRLRAEVLQSQTRRRRQTLTDQPAAAFPASTPPMLHPAPKKEDAMDDDDATPPRNNDEPRLLGRTQNERAEQEGILTALRSARRRHSLPPLHDPVYAEQAEHLIEQGMTEEEEDQDPSAPAEDASAVQASTTPSSSEEEPVPEAADTASDEDAAPIRKRARESRPKRRHKESPPPDTKTKTRRRRRRDS